MGSGIMESGGMRSESVSEGSSFVANPTSLVSFAGLARLTSFVGFVGLAGLVSFFNVGLLSNNV